MQTQELRVDYSYALAISTVTMTQKFIANGAKECGKIGGLRTSIFLQFSREPIPCFGSPSIHLGLFGECREGGMGDRLINDMAR